MRDEVIQELINTGKITQEAVDEARVKTDSVLQACAFAMHTLLCNKEHAQDPDMLLQPAIKKCKWYLESDVLKDYWSAPEHSIWLRRTLVVMREQEITEPEMMRAFLQRLSEVVADVRSLISWYPKSFRLLKEAIGE